MNAKLNNLETYCLIILLCLSPNAWAAVDFHFVTSQGGTGVRDGTTWARAFSKSDFENKRNWDSDVANDNKIGPGDTVYFRGRFTDRLAIVGSGSPGNPVTLDGYAEGSYDAIMQQPSPASLAKVQTKNMGVKLAGQAYIILQDFEFDGKNGEMADGVVIYNYKKSLARHITIRDCYFHHLSRRGISTGRDSLAYEHANENITVGGARGDGNEFYAIGKATDSYDVKMAYVWEWVVSYNKMHAPEKDSEFGNSGVSWGGYRNETKSGLIEYNDVCCHNSILKSEDGIGGKGGTDIIIRFNHVTNHRGKGEGTGIQACWGDGKNIYVYGNLIEQNEWGVWVTSGSGSNFSENGIPCENIYIWSNIISNTSVGDGIRIGGWEGTDVHREIYVFNNWIINNAINPINYLTGKDAAFTGISVVRTSQDIHIRNNIIADNRPSGSSGNLSQIYVQAGLEFGVEIDNNLFFHSAGVPSIYSYSRFAPASDTGMGNFIENPQLLSSGTGVYTLNVNSPVSRMSDPTPGTLGTVVINGSTYTMTLNDLLDPNMTDWDQVPPIVEIRDHGDRPEGLNLGPYAEW